VGIYLKSRAAEQLYSQSALTRDEVERKQFLGILLAIFSDNLLCGRHALYLD
jgi:hypothetical protein